jgi:predicted transcriptional regulator
MTKHVRTVEISETSDVRLRHLSDKTGLKPGEIVERALERFQDDLDDIGEDERRWAQFERDEKAIPGDAIKAWIESWGTANELPTPKP